MAEDGIMYFGFTGVSAFVICHLACSLNIDTMTRPQESQRHGKPAPMPLAVLLFSLPAD